jgi:phytoene dehydrogenase-like protein
MQSGQPAQVTQADVVVIGGGFGGLGCALALAEAGRRVVVLERVGYLGGCAGTFSRHGEQFEAGATLSAGLRPDQLFGRWLARHNLDVAVQWLDPVVELRSADVQLAVPAQRSALIATLAQLAGDRASNVRQFFALQQQVAQALWPVLDDPTLLPPLNLQALLRHTARLPQYLPLLRWLGRPLLEVLEEYGLGDEPHVRLLCDTACQITVQCPAAEAEAVLALATLDYWFAGAAHVVGGIGALATALGGAITGLQSELHLHSGVVGLERSGPHWLVTTRHGQWQTPVVVANLLPEALSQLLGPDVAPPRLAALDRGVQTGWGAFVLYLTLRAPPEAGPQAVHLDLTTNPADLTLGQHLFLSVSSANDLKATDGLRTAVLSTHVPLQQWRQAGPAQQAELAELVYGRMQAGLQQLAPEWATGIQRLQTASPRTWQRFTGRPGGAVGGIPKRAGLHNYQDLWPRPLLPGLYLVGDSVFPGQSALATATGGVRTAAHILQSTGVHHA